MEIKLPDDRPVVQLAEEGSWHTALPACMAAAREAGWTEPQVARFLFLVTCEADGSRRKDDAGQFATCQQFFEICKGG